MKIKLIFLFLILFFNRGTALKSEDYQSNFDWLQTLSEHIINDCFQSNLPDSTQKIVLQAIAPQDSQNWFLENMLVQNLRKYNIPLIVLNDEAVKTETTGNPTGLLLKYRILDLKIRYRAAKKWFFMPTKIIERQAQVIIFLQLENLMSKQLIWSGILTEKAQQEIPSNQIDEIEFPALSFTRAPVPSKSYFQQFFEPVITLGSTGLIVYLFYSYRSR